MKRLIVDSVEKNEILKMHGFLNEAPDPLLDGKSKLEKAIKLGCIAKYAWFTPNPGRPIALLNDKSSYVIFGKDGDKGNTYYFYPDLTAINVQTGAKKKWTCDGIDAIEPKQLNANQKEVLDILKRTPDGWFTEPVPSEVALDDGRFVRADLTNTEDPNIKGKDIEKYVKYFPKTDFPNPFYIYKRNISRPNTTTPGTTSGVNPVTTSGQAVDPMVQSLQTLKTQEYALNECKTFVDEYFKKAQLGADDPKLSEYQSAVTFCNNKNRANWSEDTKDQLRWLTGREDEAKKILGLFKKYPRIGNIRDTAGRRKWRLIDIPQI